MIFGQSKQQKLCDLLEQKIEESFGVLTFALIPARLTTGEWVWLDYYYRYYTGLVVSGDGRENHTDIKIVESNEVYRNFADRSRKHERLVFNDYLLIGEAAHYRLTSLSLNFDKYRDQMVGIV